MPLQQFKQQVNLKYKPLLNLIAIKKEMKEKATNVCGVGN